MGKFCARCGAELKEGSMFCSVCGAPAGTGQERKIEEPHTIEELKLWYLQKKLPPEEVTRYFIGKDVKEPKAYGIYRDAQSGLFIVYKNKSDGSRAVRYSGPDEAFAVSELFHRLRQETSFQKSRSAEQSTGQNERRAYAKAKRKTSTSIKRQIIVIVCIFLFVIVLDFLINGSDTNDSHNTRPDAGYYYYEDTYYYNQYGDWYYYSYSDDCWYAADISDELYDDYDDYYESYDYQGDWDLSSFADSDYYDANASSDDYDSSDYNSNDSYDYDDDSWDSYDSWDSDSYSDWDSDW